MSTLNKPKFRNLLHGECAGAPILRRLWDFFDFSFLLTQSGINKVRGVPTWMLAFLYAMGLIAQCTSVNKIADLAKKDALLNIMFRGMKITQITLSRFLTTSYDWSLFGHKRVERLQVDQDTRLQDGDVINLDDSQVVHPYGKMLSFLCWLFDHSLKINVWGMNIVVIQAVLRNGIEYPLFYKIWRKPKVKGEGPTKYDHAREMLIQLRKSVDCRLWVAMDRWYLSKKFFNFLTANSFDWVTKAKRNTALFRKEIESWSGSERYVPVKPIMLIKEVFSQLKAQGKSGIASVSLPNIYMKMPYEIVNKKGKTVTKHRFTPIAVVAAIRLKEDETEYNEVLSGDQTLEQPAEYRGAYLIISIRFDAPKEALFVYIKRWRIELFFRAAKQELGLNECHSTTEVHHHAHYELIFAAETLVSYAQWQANQGKLSDEEVFTHGQIINSLFHIRCEIRIKSHKIGIQQVTVSIDTDAKKFIRLFDLYWPDEVRMFLGCNFSGNQFLLLTA